MNYSIRIDQINATAWGLNMTEAGAFDYLYTIPTWADPVTIKGEIFYFVARQKMCQDIPLVVSKEDTAYRILKSLSEKGVLNYVKFGVKDCIQITALGKGWNSEKNPINTVELGKKSESTRKIFRNGSEKNPTYPLTIYPNTKDHIEEHQKQNDVLAIVHDQVDKTKVTVLDPMKDKASKQMQFVTEVVEYLNQKTNQSFKITTKETIQFINGRMNVDKWELEDFKNVIDFKTNEWLKDDKMRQYLCPSTLFRQSNAEKYLLAANAWKSKQKPQPTPQPRITYREEKPVFTQQDIEASEQYSSEAAAVFKSLGVRV